MASDEKKRIYKDTGIYISSNYVAQLFGMIVSIASKRFLGPSMVGIWNLVHVILGYCAYSTLGTSKAAFREIPYHRGRGENDKAEQVKNEVFTFTVLVSILPAIGIAIYALVTKDQHSKYFFAGLIFIALIIVWQRIYDYYTTLLRASKDFVTIAQVTILSACLNLLFVFILVRPFQIYGLFLSTIISTAAGLGFVYIKTKYAFKWQLTREGLSKLLGIGIPLLLTGLCMQTIKSIDKIMIAKYLGVAALGNYSVSLMAHQYIVGIPNMLAIVLYPRLQEKFGQRGSAEGVKHYLIHPSWGVALITGYLAGIAILVMPYLVHMILPSFVGGLDALRVFMWTSFFMAIGQQAITFLVTLDKQWRMLPILVLGIILVFGLCMFAVKGDGSLVGVAFAVVCATAIYNLILSIYAQSQFSNAREIGQYVIIILLMILYFIVVNTWIRQFGSETNLMDVCFKVIVYSLMTTVPAYFVNKRTGIVSNLYTMIREKVQRKNEGRN